MPLNKPYRSDIHYLYPPVGFRIKRRSMIAVDPEIGRHNLAQVMIQSGFRFWGDPNGFGGGKFAVAMVNPRTGKPVLGSKVLITNIRWYYETPALQRIMLQEAAENIAQRFVDDKLAAAARWRKWVSTHTVKGS